MTKNVDWKTCWNSGSKEIVKKSLMSEKFLMDLSMAATRRDSSWCSLMAIGSKKMDLFREKKRPIIWKQ